MDDAVFIGGPEKRDIVIEDYDPAWTARFEQIDAALRRGARPTARRIEHFGSTAVPGLGAKGIVDVLVTVDDADDEAAYAPALERAGFAIRLRQPGHRMFRTPDQDVHVHVYSEGSDAARHPPPVPRLAPPQPRGPASLRGHQARVGAPGVGGDERLLHRQGRGGGRDPGPRAALGRLGAKPGTLVPSGAG